MNLPPGFVADYVERIRSIYAIWEIGLRDWDEGELPHLFHPDDVQWLEGIVSSLGVLRLINKLDVGSIDERIALGKTATDRNVARAVIAILVKGDGFVEPDHWTPKQRRRLNSIIVAIMSALQTERVGDFSERLALRIEPLVRAWLFNEASDGIIPLPDVQSLQEAEEQKHAHIGPTMFALGIYLVSKERLG